MTIRLHLAPRWLFTAATLEWIGSREICRQFPLLFRLYFSLCRLSLTVGAQHDGTRERAVALWLLIGLWKASSRFPYRVVSISGIRYCLLLTDPRFIQVVEEARGRAPTAMLPRLLRPGDTFVDIGANQGGFAALASQIVGPKGFIMAIEAQPALGNCLSTALALGAAAFEVHALRLGSAGGEGAFFVPTSYSGMGSVARQFAADMSDVTEMRVPCATLDLLTRGRMFPGKVVVKLDVEGAEVSCLEGAREFIAAMRPAIMTEVNAKALRATGESLESLSRILGDCGYHTYRSIYALEIEKKTTELCHETASDIVLLPST